MWERGWDGWRQGWRVKQVKSWMKCLELNKVRGSGQLWIIIVTKKKTNEDLRVPMTSSASRSTILFVPT